MKLNNDVEIYLGDCLNVMYDISDMSIDMILCDLPYGVTSNKKDITLPFDKLWEHYERIIKDNGAIALFGQGIFYADLVCSNRKLYKYDLIWDKQLVSGFLNAKRMPLRQHEQIAIFYKKPPIYNPQYTVGQPSHSKGNIFKEKENINNNYGYYTPIDADYETTRKYPTSIISVQKPHPSKAIHPTQKPVEILEWLIKTYTNENDLVLDNCMGSGSTGVACINTNRRFIGIEKEEKYFNIAKERLEKSLNGAQNT